MHRSTLWSIGLMLLAASLVTGLGGCASLPPAKPAVDIKAITGRWEGTLTAPNGRQFAFTSTIREDGTVETVIPGLSNPGPQFLGKVTLQGGQYRWSSETTGRTGTYTLHEGDGRRVLVSRADDGSSHAESRPAK